MKPNCFSDKSLDFRGSHYAFVLYRGEYLFAQGGDKGKQVKHDIVMKPESAKKQTGFFKSNKSRWEIPLGDFKQIGDDKIHAPPADHDADYDTFYTDLKWVYFV